MYTKPRFLLAGDSALVVEFGDDISEEVNRKVHALVYFLEKNPLPGIGEAVPTYRSLLVHYDSLRLSYGEVKDFVADLLQKGEEIACNRILRIHPTVDPITRQGTVEVVLDTPPPEARPGQLSRVELTLRPQPRLTVPFPALRRDTQGEYVFLYGDDSSVHYTPVVSGLHLGERIEIVNGLKESQRVVINGFLGLNDGMEVSLAGKTASAEGSAQR